MRVPARYIVIALSLALAALPAAAADKEYRTDAGEQVVAAGSIGGSWFIIATAMYDLFSRHIDGLRYTITPGGAISNPIAISQGMATAAYAYTSMLFAAQAGQPPFKAPITDMRGILNLNVAGVLHPIFLSDTGITSLADIAAREIPLRVDTGPRGTGGELAASRLLELYGAGYDNIRAWGGSITHSSYREALDRMKDGHIDAFINDDIVGQPLFVDIALSRDVVFLPMTPEVVTQMVERFGYARASIPANTYKGQDAEIPSTAQLFAFTCHKDLPEDLVYAMTRLTFEHRDELIATHKVFSDLSLEAGPTHFPIPLHPGAERYYREVGVLP